jgi:small-conductance mechanosensitive channel
VRIAVLALILAAVAVAGSLWKRAVHKYVHDVQRRYQFLFLRRMAMWVLVALIVAFSFAGQLGSFATFAGLMTAGVAVALQNVILSVVGYFFLIGKYGIRVGDRVQIGGVTGQVLDIGLVRLHLLEYGGGADSPTGRVVAFSNSMVFQSSTGMYKYMPDIQLSWHELTLMLAGDTDLGSARSRLLHATEGALTEFHPGLEKEAQRLEASVGLSQHHTLQPTVRLRVQAGGLETTVYYPVDAEHSAEIDEKVAIAIRQALEREPPLNMAGATSTGLRLRTST